jgi:hypothetical protein
MPVFSDVETRIVGVIDAVFVDIDASTAEEDVFVLHLRDWKYSMLCPVQTLQLNMYAHLLETYYREISYGGKTYSRIRVDSMELVYFHESFGYRRVTVPRHQEEVDHILETHRMIVSGGQNEE